MKGSFVWAFVFGDHAQIILDAAYLSIAATLTASQPFPGMIRRSGRQGLRIALWRPLESTG